MSPLILVPKHRGIIAIGNNAGRLIDDVSQLPMGGNTPVANADRAGVIATYSEVTQYAQGAAQQAQSQVAEFIAPTVEVPTAVGQYKAYDSKNRFMIPDTSRGIGGMATMLQFNATDPTYNCRPHALDMPVDKYESDNGSFSLMEAADVVAQVGALAHEKQVIDAALAAAGSASSLDWSSDSTEDVVDTLDQQIQAVILACGYGGLASVRMLFGTTQWRYFKNHDNVRGLFVNNGENGMAVITENTASGLFLGMPNVKISMLCYDSTKPGKTQSNAFALDSDILIFAAVAPPTRFDPSFMKTFRQRGAWMKPRTYQREDGRVDVAAFDWTSDVKVTNSVAVKRVSGSLT